MEVTSAVRRYLLGNDAVKGQVQKAVWKERLEEAVNSGGKAIVISEQPFGTVPHPIKTDEWPTVWIDCYADSTRDAQGNIIKTDALDKARALMRVVVPLVHGKRGVWWGAVGSDPGLMVISSAQIGRRYFSGVEDATHGGTYGVGAESDQSVMVARIILAMNVAH